MELFKSKAQVKFDNVVKAFHSTLKPLGFKKKAASFYRFENGVGHHINLQKNKWNDRDNVSFTINTGISNDPKFPAEYHCNMRLRIGELKGSDDLWYQIDNSTDEANLIIEVWKDLNDFILPHFSKLTSREAADAALAAHRRRRQGLS